MTKIKNLSILSFLFLFIFCNKDQTEQVFPVEFKIKDTEKSIAETCNHLGFDFFLHLTENHDMQQNLIFSPIGFNFSLNHLIYASGSNSRSKLKKALGLGNTSDSILANGIENLGAIYNMSNDEAKIEFSYHFAFSKQIAIGEAFSAYTKSKFIKTSFEPNSGFIPDLPLNSEKNATGFQMINTINSKVYCLYQSRLADAPFYHNPDKSSFVSMIVSEALFNFYSDANIKAIEIPLGKGNLNMLIIIPQDNESLCGLIKNLDYNKLGKVKAQLKPRHFELYMPEIRISQIKSHTGNLESKKLMNHFKPGFSNFSGSGKKENMFLSDFEQVIDFELSFNKKNLKAIHAKSDDRKSGSFFIDRPFVYAIYEKHSNAIALIGTIVNP